MNAWSGKVYLVGAGPGDPGLITLRGVECLKRADVVLFDYLVNPVLLRHVPVGVKTISLGRHGESRIWNQAEINDRMVELARAGNCVVRLKGGDPAIFARSAEEAAALSDAGIDFEIVPGITAALAAGSCSGIALTDRALASGVALVTGQQAPDNGPALDYRRLADFPGTLVFYMGVTTASTWTAALLSGGKAAETPVAIVRRCSLPDQQTTHCTLAEAAERLAKLRPPVVVIIGPVAEESTRWAWFEQRPLFGTSVLVTRSAGQADDLADQFAEQGAEIRLQAAIEIAPPDDWKPVDRAIAQLTKEDWLVFSSSNGVRAVMDRLWSCGYDARGLNGCRIAVNGPGTADALLQFGLRADLQPAEFRAEALAATLVAAGVEGRRCVLIRANRGRHVLGEMLVAAGAELDQVIGYVSRDVTQPDATVLADLEAGRIDWVTVTSSAIARSLAGLFGDALHAARLASISPITSATLRELGFEPAVEAAAYTTAGLVDAIVRATE